MCKEIIKIENIEEKKYWVWITLINGLGIKRLRKLLETYKKPKNMFNLTKKELLNISGISEKIVDNIINEKTKNELNKHIKYMLNNNIDIISIQDSKYPQLLRQIYDPPIALYIKGNRKILNGNNIAIIGCRNASEYGKKASKYFSYNLTKCGLNIVSGLAKGIDSYSHIGNICALTEKSNIEIEKLDDKSINSCNNNYGKTIAVVGNGLNIVYPKENQILQEKILECGGCIISEYPLGTKPEKANFPARNRIISGISKGVLVIEAQEKSGTLITTDFALEHGRDVYVVPGNINSINSVGTNELIKQGAKLVTNYKEIEY